MNNTLTGHSGCTLELLELDDELIVRKTSPHDNYNQRLKNQYEKQSKVTLNSFQQTKTVNSGVNPDGMFYFDMEYIPGNTLAHMFAQLNSNQLDNIVDIFAGLYKNENETYSRHVYLEKISELKSQLKPDIRSKLDLVFQKLLEYEWSIDKSQACHGDLGFENILLLEDELFIIDLLDSFSNSWVMDIAKILQDVEMHWAFRSLEISDEICERLEHFRVKLFHKLLQRGLTFKQYSDCYYVLLLNLMRILPYSKSMDTDEFLLLAITKTSTKIFTLELDYEYLNRTVCR